MQLWVAMKITKPYVTYQENILNNQISEASEEKLNGTNISLKYIMARKGNRTQSLGFSYIKYHPYIPLQYLKYVEKFQPKPLYGNHWLLSAMLVRYSKLTSLKWLIPIQGFTNKVVSTSHTD